MTRLTKCLAAVAVVAGVGFAAQSASAAPPVVVGRPVIVTHPTYPTYPTYPVPSYYPRPYPVYSVPPVVYPVPRIDYDYVLLYRPSVFSGWQTYGKFETRYGAEAAERRLEWSGIPSRIVRVRDYNGNFPW